MAKILIAGGTGLVGKHLSRLLKEQGDEILHLSRRLRPDSAFTTYRWNPEEGLIDMDSMHDIDYIINLAGTGVADKRWSDSRKKSIIDSRVKGATVFEEYIRDGKLNPKAYISASAIGIYGNTEKKIINEENKTGAGFLAECTHQWEQAIGKVAQTGTRTVGLRIGIVLSMEGGALEKILMPFKLGVGNWFGDGEQIYSWIHIEDVSRMFIHALNNEKMQGFYNAVAPHPVSIKEMAYAIKDVKGKPYLMAPVPSFGLRIALGEMADVVLNSNHISCKKIMSAGFEFKFPKIHSALEELLNTNKI